MTHSFIGAFRHFERAVYQLENIVNTHGSKRELDAAIQAVETERHFLGKVLREYFSKGGVDNAQKD